MLTHQEIFDRVVERARASKRRCLGNDGEPLYRSGELTSFVGSLIPKDLYKPELEGYTIFLLMIERYIDVGAVKNLRMWSFLGELERIHANIEPSQWETALGAFASVHDLKFEGVKGTHVQFKFFKPSMVKK